MNPPAGQAAPPAGVPGKEAFAMRAVRTRWIALLLLPAAAFLVLLTRPVWSHCQIPCGIYDDAMQLRMIAQDIATIEKAMKQIERLGRQPERNDNQIVRWVQNKEEHAQAIQDVVARYFMTQRLKPVHEVGSKAYARYIRQLTLLHEMLLHAMKAKQTTDLAHVEKLRELTRSFRQAYLGPAEHDQAR